MIMSKHPWHLLILSAVLTGGTGCSSEEEFNEEIDEQIESDAESDVEFRAALSPGVHGTYPNPKVKTAGVVNEYLAQYIPSNTKQVFWWFCGQSATATAINFARGDSPSDATKKVQLQWFHDRLKFYQPTNYSLSDPLKLGGKFATRIDWLYDLMKADKSGDFITTVLTPTSGTAEEMRESIKLKMGQALDGGAFVVGLNRTSDFGVGHFLTVYAINYQPLQAEGGTVYYGDPLNGSLGTVGFKTFLDRMRSQSAYGLYNAFSVKQK